jgi:TatD DNase family protein
MQLIDSHCHLDFSEFESDLSSVINRAKLQGVTSFIIPGVSSKRWDKQLKLAQAFDNVYCAVGIHPWFLDTQVSNANISDSKVSDQKALTDLTQLESLLQSKSVIAVGECGLDATIDNMLLQQQVFMAQIELANRFNKPLIIHHRKTHHLIQQCFKQLKPKCGGVIHAFSGNVNDAQKYIDLGFKLGIGGGITYERASKTRTSVLNVGLSNILLETDSPDMPLFGQQGKRNEPQNIFKVAEAVAELFSCSVEEVAEITSANTKELFGI